MNFLQSLKEMLLPAPNPLLEHTQDDWVTQRTKERVKAEFHAAYRDGLDVNVHGPEGRTPLMSYASVPDFDDVVAEALEMGADVNAMDDHGRTALMYVDNVETAKVLLHHGANPNHQNADGKTAFHLFENRDWGVTEVQELLLKHGADLNLQDNRGDTVLHLAVRAREHALWWEDVNEYAGRFCLSPIREKCILAFLEHGADPSIKNKAGLSAGEMYLAQGDKSPEIEAKVESVMSKSLLQKVSPRAPMQNGRHHRL